MREGEEVIRPGVIVPLADKWGCRLPRSAACQRRLWSRSDWRIKKMYISFFDPPFFISSLASTQVTIVRRKEKESNFVGVQAFFFVYEWHFRGFKGVWISHLRCRILGGKVSKIVCLAFKGIRMLQAREKAHTDCYVKDRQSFLPNGQAVSVCVWECITLWHKHIQTHTHM